MKKTLAILCLLCITVMRAAAFDWTDGNGVTWTVGQRSFTLNGTSQQLWTIIDVKGYGEILEIPDTVYNSGFPCAVEAIARGLFDNNGLVYSMTLPATIKYIDRSAFNFYGGTLTMRGTTPPQGLTQAIGNGVTILVPDESVDTYRNANGWKEMSVRILGQNTKSNYDITVTAQANYSGIHQAIGDVNIINVMSLKVTGSINSYDIMIMRDKMYNLHYLDLTNANIVANNYTYYGNCSTSSNALGDNTFRDKTNLLSVKLPNTITSIGNDAFYSCKGLRSVSIPNSVISIGNYAFYSCNGLRSVSIPNSVTSIGKYAFSYCSSLTSVHISDVAAWCKIDFVNIDSNPLYYARHLYLNGNEIKNLTIPEGVSSINANAFRNASSITSVSLPNSVTNIGYSTFSGCSSLTSLTIPKSVTSIEGYAFYDCSSLTSVSLPNSVTSIGAGAFQCCSSLTEVRIPSSIRSIGNLAFSDCTNLKDYYAYTVEPTSIEDNTFSNWTTATLHIPSLAYYNYYYDTKWKKFYRLVEDVDYKYEYFYLNQDLTFTNSNSNLDSSPDVDLNAGSSLIVETTNSTVKLDEVHMADNGTASASIIADNNLTVENLYFDIAVTANKWYFVSFPFRVKLSNVTTPGNFVFRYYDGAERATNGKGGWKNVTGTYLNAHQGYIFQTNTTGTLTLKVEKADMDFAGGERQDALTTYTAQSTTNASWNFIGNPHSSYFDIDDTGYDAPITVWNGSTYQAVRAGDDQYHLSPFQAFFVQKPQGTASVRFPASGRHTYNQWADRVAGKQAAARANVAADAMTTRQIVNLTISNGEQTDDQTRVVFNAAKSAAYEMDCDAAKFFSDQPVAQLYTVDGEGTQYAINERPQGEVNIGFVAVKSGELQISAVRMDQPVYLRDNELNITHDLSLSGYTFTTSEGTNDSRFTLLTENTLTGIAEVEDSQSTVRGSFYDLQGRRIVSPTLKKGAYIVKDGQKTTKHLSR